MTLTWRQVTNLVKVAWLRARRRRVFTELLDDGTWVVW